MASKAKAPTAEEPKVNEEPEVNNDEVAPQEPESDTNKILDEEIGDRQNKRKSEWGTQFDRWLIRCQQKGGTVLLYLGEFDPMISENGIKAIPRRIDQHFVQFEIEGRDVWLGKRFIAGVEAARSGE